MNVRKIALFRPFRGQRARVTAKQGFDGSSSRRVDGWVTLRTGVIAVKSSYIAYSADTDEFDASESAFRRSIRIGRSEPRWYSRDDAPKETSGIDHGASRPGTVSRITTRTVQRSIEQRRAATSATTDTSAANDGPAVES